ncbi:MAG: aldehyde dehydrogenase family protein [Microcoleus sp. SU_5_6]|nr:aldehyde dehydrogenase family protein [Microcoleus sp. SU_5_6]
MAYAGSFVTFGQGNGIVVAIANDTPFGLASYFFTRDVNRAWRVAERIESGMVSINDGIFSNEVIPFGGWKDSGLGGEECLDELLSYTQVKAVHVLP